MTLGLQVFEPAALGLTAERYRVLRNVFDTQSYVFYCEMLPHLWNLYPSGYHHLTLLDVGSRTGAGSGLLQQIHHPESFSRIKLNVTALDIEDTYVDYAKAHYPEVEYVVGDIYDPTFSRKFDIVVCSHTLEHVPDPSGFLAQLRSLARGWVVIACPFEEKDLIPGHVNTLDFSFFEKEQAHTTHVYRSLTWHGSMAAIATFRGTAST